MVVFDGARVRHYNQLNIFIFSEASNLQVMSMKSSIATAVFLLLLCQISIVSGYTLEGQWRLNQ